MRQILNIETIHSTIVGKFLFYFDKNWPVSKSDRRPLLKDPESLTTGIPLFPDLYFKMWKKGN